MSTLTNTNSVITCTKGIICEVEWVGWVKPLFWVGQQQYPRRKSIFLDCHTDWTPVASNPCQCVPMFGSSQKTERPKVPEIMGRLKLLNNTVFRVETDSSYSNAQSTASYIRNSCTQMRA